MPDIRCLISSIVFFLFLVPVSPAQTSVETFDNGIHLAYHYSEKTPLASLQLWIRSGRCDDPPGGKGTAELLTFLLRGPILRNALAETSPPLDRCGIDVGSSCEDDAITLSLTVPAVHAPDIALVLSRMIGQPAFSVEDLAAAKKFVVDKLRQEKSSPEKQLEHQLRSLAFTIHPYMHMDFDALDTVEDISLSTVRNELTRRFIPKNIILAVAGGFDRDELRLAAAQGLGELPCANSPTRPVIVEPKPVRPRSITVRGKFPVSRLAVAFITPPARSSEYTALLLLCELLGPDSSADIRRELLDQLPSRSMFSVELWARREPGLFILTATGKNLDPSGLRNRIIALVNSLDVDKISLADLAEAKTRLSRKIRLRWCTSISAARELGLSTILMRPISLKDTLAELDKVDIDSIERTVRDYLSEGSSLTVIQAPFSFPTRPALKAGDKLREYRRVRSLSGVHLVFAPPVRPGWVSCQILVKCAPTKKSIMKLKAAFAGTPTPEFSGRGGGFCKVPTINPLHFLSSGASECFRVGFICETTRFFRTFTPIFRKTIMVQSIVTKKRVPPPDRVFVAIAGDVDPDVCRKSVDRTITRIKLEKMKLLSMHLPPTRQSKAPVFFRALELRAPERNSRLAAATYCLAEILSERMRTRLTERQGYLVKHRVVYYPMLNKGALFVDVVVAPENRARVVSDVASLYNELHSSRVSERTAAAAAARCRVKLLEEALDPCKRALNCALDEMHGAGPHGAMNLFRSLEHISVQEIEEAAQFSLSTQRFSIFDSSAGKTFDSGRP